MKRAYFLVLPDLHMLDLAGPLQIMSTLGELGLAAVSTQCIGPRARVRSFQGAWLDDVHPLPGGLLNEDVLFVIGSKLTVAATRSPAWLDTLSWLRKVVAQSLDSVRICSVCTGSFVLAHAGLLNGRLCTTHHAFTSRLQSEFPLAHVVENRLLVKHGRYITSAGVASGIDLALHLISEDFGHDAALQVARENVVHFRRFGNDPELSVALRYRDHGNRRVHAVQDALSAHLSGASSCEALAERVGLSYRQLARIFRVETGVTVKQYQLDLRMELARQLLMDSSLSIERLVERCGFDSVQAFRSNWNKREAVPPSAFRRLGRSASSGSL